MNEQLNLFLEPSAELPPHEPDTAAIAAAGERRNQNYDPNERRAEQQRGAGGGFAAATAGELEPEETVTPVSVIRSVPVRSPLSRNRLSARGKLLADREPDTAHDPAYQEPVILTAEEKAAGKRGMEIMKQALAEERARRSAPTTGLDHGTGE